VLELLPRQTSDQEVRPMSKKKRLIPDEAIRREWLRQVKEMWEKRKRRKREKK
jgi:hypothetical protein